MMKRTFALVTLSLGCASALAAEGSGSASRDPVIRLNETVISGNQELPKVLYIVPWKQPDGLPELEIEPEFSERAVFRRLYPPAYRRELEYYQMLDESNDITEE